MDALRVPDSRIVSTIREIHPEVQAIYLFGSHGTAYERADSDVDLALLLPPAVAKSLGSLTLGPCAEALAELLHRPVDLVNLRMVDTVFQARIIETGRLLYTSGSSSGSGETANFEMLTLSYYQKLNEERAEIIQDIVRTGRVLAT